MGPARVPGAAATKAAGKKKVRMRLAREAQGCGVQEREKRCFLLVVSLVLRMAWLNLIVSSAVAYLQWQPLGRCKQYGIKGRDGQGASSTPQTRAEQEGRRPGAQSEVLLGI